MVAYLKLLIAKMKRERFGQSAERGRKLLDQLELQLEELEASATEDEVAAGPAEPDPTTMRGFTRRTSAGTAAGPPATRAGDGASAEFLPVLRRQAGQTRRGHHRDPRSRAAALESDPDRAREVHLPVLREDHPAARTLSRHRPRAGWGELVGDDPLRQVWRASAAQPAERIVCPGGHRARRVDPGGLGRRLHSELGAARRIDSPSRARRRASARRRHDRAGPGQGQNRNRPTVDLCQG